jgi:hypothetical protein
LTFSNPFSRSSSNNSSPARVAAWAAQEAAGVGVVAVQRAVRVVASQIARAGTDQAEIGQAEARRQFALIGQRLREQHAGLQEQHRGRPVDL